MRGLSPPPFFGVLPSSAWRTFELPGLHLESAPRYRERCRSATLSFTSQSREDLGQVSASASSRLPIVATDVGRCGRRVAVDRAPTSSRPRDPRPAPGGSGRAADSAELRRRACGGRCAQRRGREKGEAARQVLDSFRATWLASGQSAERIIVCRSSRSCEEIGEGSTLSLASTFAGLRDSCRGANRRPDAVGENGQGRW